MENSPSHGLEWFKSHASWELAKWIVERFILLPFFAWLISLGYARMVHAALSTAFDLFLILLGIIGVVWIFGFTLKSKTAKTESAQNRQLATNKLARLTARGHHLLNNAPKNGASVSDFVAFWTEEIGAWTSATGSALKDAWDKDTFDFFFSTTG
jgi:hypothetical protein